jgi:hypothetical protein
MRGRLGRRRYLWVVGSTQIIDDNYKSLQQGVFHAPAAPTIDLDIPCTAAERVAKKATLQAAPAEMSVSQYKPTSLASTGRPTSASTCAATGRAGRHPHDRPSLGVIMTDAGKSAATTCRRAIKRWRGRSASVQAPSRRRLVALVGVFHQRDPSRGGLGERVQHRGQRGAALNREAADQIERRHSGHCRRGRYRPRERNPALW